MRPFHHKQPSFTLVELLLYTAMFAFFALLLFGFYSDVYKRITLIKQANSKIVRVTVALDLLRRDLMSASVDLQDWDFKNLVFKKNFLDKNGYPALTFVAWGIDNKGLWRRDGNYNLSSQSWLKSNVAFLGNEIKTLNVYLETDVNRKIRAKVRYSVDGKVERCFFVLLRNRIWL